MKAWTASAFGMLPVGSTAVLAVFSAKLTWRLMRLASAPLVCRSLRMHVHWLNTHTHTYSLTTHASQYVILVLSAHESSV
jgi:hypothetical protein